MGDIEKLTALIGKKGLTSGLTFTIRSPPQNCGSSSGTIAEAMWRMIYWCRWSGKRREGVVSG